MTINNLLCSYYIPHSKRMYIYILKKSPYQLKKCLIDDLSNSLLITNEFYLKVIKIDNNFLIIIMIFLNYYYYN